ncbi:MAG: DUF3450 domain-containing protein [Desulfobacteraceae bacterium]
MIPSLAPAGQKALDIHRTVKKEICVRKKMQQQEDRWAEKRQVLEERYKTLERRLNDLEIQKKRLSGKLDLRRKKTATMEQTLTESGRVKKELQLTLEDIVDRLDRFAANDLPFLKTERSERIHALRTCLLDPDVTLAEKTRRTFESLQVELDYGHRLEVTEEEVEIGGRKMAVDVLRVGRISLFCRTGDGGTTGRYAPAEKSWQPLHGKYDAAITEAMEMARQQRPMDMIKLPLGELEVQ